MVVVALLAGVLISTIGVTVAAGERNPVLTRVIFGSDLEGCWLGPAAGIITFDTETGDWTVTTHAPLPPSDANLYFPSITLSAPQGRDAGCAVISFGTVRSVDGRIEASGTVPEEAISEIMFLLEDRSVFVLTTNSI
jgi:hypothetical protein